MGKLKVCADCHVLTEHTRCDQHRAQARAEARHDEDPRYRTQRWTDYSRAFRSEHAACAINAHGCTLVTDVVDHILPVRTHPHLFWEPSNHRPACQSCNQWAARQTAAHGNGRARSGSITPHRGGGRKI